MCAKAADERACPWEKHAISPAICRTRQRNQYPKCLLCPHRSAEAAASLANDPKVVMSVFRSSSVLGRVPQEINEYVIRKVGLATAQFLRSESPSGSRLVVACDLRDSSRGFARIFSEGVSRGGMETVTIGTVPPELLAFVLGTEEPSSATGAAFIGGGNYADSVNGVRIWRRDATPVGLGTGLEKVAMIARRLRTGLSRVRGAMGTASPVPDYVTYVRKFAPKLGALKVAMDGGYGVGGRLLQAVLTDLPLQLATAHFEEDGRNPYLGRRFPGQALVSAMKEQVAGGRADMGAALDFTGERVVFFDERGQLLGHDVAAGLIATELLSRSPGACVTYDLRATAALRACVAQHGGTAVAGPTRSLAFAQQFRRTEALYGADWSGLHYFRDFFRFPSPVVALLLFCSHVSREQKPVSELAADLRRFSQSGEVAIPVPSAEVAQDVLAKVKDGFPTAERELIDGVTVRQQDWWFNLRQHGEAAELLLNVEGRTEREQKKGRQTVERLVAKILAGG
jgi:phosphomannomutase